ncbi:hypothetical protein HDU91_000564 [Kappamyces sp. JEL0680]|nr:hypothetical protein HDU91_000564 [Kappamyces sp. JEL0680]
MNPPLPPGWIAQVDTKSGNTFYVDTATGKTQWQDPRGAQAHPGLATAADSRPLPPGFIAQSDARSGKTFYVNTLTRQSQWNDPRIPHANTAPAEKPLPNGFISQIDPRSGKTFYVNTLTSQSQWNDPRLDSSTPQPLHEPQQPAVSSAIATLTHQPLATAGTLPGGASTSDALPPGFISQIDPHTQRPFYIDTRTGKTQWEDPRGLGARVSDAVPSSSVTPALPSRPQSSSAAPTALGANFVHINTPSSVSSSTDASTMSGATLHIDSRPLPPGFITHTDPLSQKIFYVDTRTGKTQWEDPRAPLTRPSLPSRHNSMAAHSEPHGTLMGTETASTFTGVSSSTPGMAQLEAGQPTSAATLVAGVPQSTGANLYRQSDAAHQPTNAPTGKSSLAC